MQHICSILTALSLGMAAAGGASAKPNVLLIFTDDHGWADLGVQGVDRDIRTPNLDRLASDGVRFTRGYVTAPQCTPSRAGVISGTYQQRFGVEHNGLVMKQEVLTLPERLHAARYVCGQVGKWHLDSESEGKGGGKKRSSLPELAPQGQGFDEYFTGAMRTYEASHALDGAAFPDSPHEVTDVRCRVVVQTEAALSFLSRRAAKSEQPWFLYLAYFAPHVPMEAAEPWFSQTPKNLPPERRKALSMIGAIDDGVGRIRAKLEAMGQATNTLIFVIGDNGAPLGAVWDGSINLPMRGQKGMLSEGGIRTPFVAAWPGRIPAGQVYDRPVISLDVAATAVAAAGLTADAALDGVDLVPYLTGAKDGPPHETLYWRWTTQAAIQEFPYKLIMLGERQRLLFDITTPEGENIERNLVSKQPEIAARLEAKLKVWAAGLQPAGLSADFDAHHEGLFAEHELIGPIAPPAASEKAPPGSVQGWIARNGRTVVRDGALALVPDPASTNGRPFFACPGLNVPGPVTVTLRLRAKQGGPCTMTWRTKEQTDFVPANSVAFDCPSGAEWRVTKAELPVQGRLIHVRITPAREVREIELRTIELRGKVGAPTVWNFDAEEGGKKP